MNRERSFRIFRYVLRVFVMNTLIALIPPFILLAFTNSATPTSLFNSFRFSFVFAQCIGALGFTGMRGIWVATLLRPPWLRWLARFGGMLGACLAGSLAACLVLVLLGWMPLESYWPEFYGSLRVALFLMFTAGGTLAMYESFSARLEKSTLQLRTKELERVQALKLATEAQLASLESRIHPHFLFNTLNSISSLIPENPAQAEKLIEQMAALLRFSLDANHAGLVPLAREMKIVADYLEIERVRFGERLRYQIDLPPGLREDQVPPLAVQTLVENSVKHAVSRRREGTEIRIGAARDSGMLRLEVLDDGPEFTLENPPPGHGIDILQRRLATLFGAQGSLALDRREDRNCLTLSVPQPSGTHARIPG